MFNLLGVRLLLSGSPLPTSDLMRDTVAALEPDVGFGLTTINVPGDRRTAIFAHPDREFALPAPPTDAVALRFSYGMDAAAFGDPSNDGVEFSVVGTTDGGELVTLWSEEFVPRVDPVAPEWRSAEVSLRFAGQQVRDVRLRTAIRSNSSTDWAAWSDLEYVSSAEDPQPPPGLRLLATAGETLIYENLDAYPRAWMVHSVHVVDDLEAAMEVFEANGQRDQGGALRVTGLDLRSEAVVEVPEEMDMFSSLGECADPQPEERVVIEGYDSDTVVLTVETSCAGLLVLSDVWYPGWRAAVNGESVPILATDIAFRGVPIEAGSSRVVMTYEPASFRLGLLIAVVALLAFVGVAVFRYFMKRSQLAAAVPSGQSPQPEEPTVSPDLEQPPDPISSEPPDGE
jgi:hypothetical protein